MTSFAIITALAAASVVSGSANAGECAHATIDALPVGDYYRPSSDQVTGFPNSASPVPFRRSICPGMNALANHGYIPRNGYGITHENLGAAVMYVFNFDKNLTDTLLSRVPTAFSLDFMSHNDVLDHDASLVRDDAYFGADPAFANKTLVDALLGRSRDGKTLGVTELGETRRDRLAECEANNPECVFTSNHSATAFVQAAKFIIVYGGDVSESVTVETAHSFIWDERIPSDYVKPAEPLTMPYLQSIAAKIQAAT